MLFDMILMPMAATQSLTGSHLRPKLKATAKVSKDKSELMNKFV